jgi:hypothetical protein
MLLGKFASRSLQRDFEDCVTADERDTITFTAAVERLRERYRPSKNTTISNFMFHGIRQKQGEAFDTFVNRVKHEAAQCDFKCQAAQCTVPDTLMRDQVIIGTTNEDIQRQGLKEQWGLADLIKNGRMIEAATLGAEKLSENHETTPVKRVAGRPGKYSKKHALKQKQAQTPSQGESSSGEKCKYCTSLSCKGGKKCFAYDKECFACQQHGHLKGAKVCKAANKKHPTRRVEDSGKGGRAARHENESPETSGTEDSSDDEPAARGGCRKRTSYKARFVAHTRRTKVRKMNTKKPRYQVEVIINEQPTTMFADTGADVCVMSLQNAKKLQLPLNRTRMKIRPFGSKSVKCKGSYIGPAMYGDAVANVCIYVVDKNVETLLSGPASEELGIIQLSTRAENNTIRRVDKPAEANHPQNQYPELFTGTGLLKNHQVKLHIDESVRPVAEPPRPIPFHLQHRHREEIKQMEAAGIIEEHQGPAPWVSNTVISPKEDGGIRLTIDMRNPNKAIQPTNLPIPRAEEIRSRLAGCKVFSKCDFKTAFHQLELEPESREITVFHDGNNRLMQYTRLPMGTSPASGELNKALTPLFRDLQGAHVIHDDLILATETEELH